MGPVTGFDDQLRLLALHVLVSKENQGKNILHDAMIFVHHQVARYAVELDQDRVSGLQMVATGL